MIQPLYTIPAEQRAYEEAYAAGYAGRDWSTNPEWPCASAKGYWTGRDDADAEYAHIHAWGERMIALVCVAVVFALGIYITAFIAVANR
jgi:hypothetical protein